MLSLKTGAAQNISPLWGDPAKGERWVRKERQRKDRGPEEEESGGSPAAAKDGLPRASGGDVLEMKERAVSSQNAQNN